jgi:carbonic anhydrase
MLRSMFHSRRRDSRPVRRLVVPVCEALEHRTVLNGASITAGIGATVLNHGQGYVHTHEIQPDLQSAHGTIAGKITVAGRGIGGIEVQLIDSSGAIAKTTVTNALGQYLFTITANGPYVVREVAPRHFVQTSPTFVYSAPEGPTRPGSWSYDTGNTDPRLGPVGVYGWHTIAPAGNLPFESPINISVPPIDLSKYLTITYKDTKAKIINTRHDITGQIAPSSSVAIKVGGQEFKLAKFHFHDPSEDQVYGKGYSMEEHFVNTSASGAVTVLSVFLQLGKYNRALQPILDAVSSDLPSAGTATTPSTPIRFTGLLPSSMQGWFYEGSLTSPPLSQPINWFVFATPITLSFRQLQQYEQVAKASGFLPNARPIQPLNGRQVNEFNYNVNFQGRSVAGLNFTLARLLKA